MKFERTNYKDFSVHIKGGVTLDNYIIEKVECERLKGDFLAFVKHGQPKGGIYLCQPTPHGRQIELLLKFDELAYIEIFGNIEK